MVYLNRIKNKKKGFYNMKKIYSWNAVAAFLASGKVANYKITKVEKVGFNDMEGSIYHVNIKIETLEGYKNTFVTFEINSTYIDELEDDETITDYLTTALFSYYALG